MEDKNADHPATPDAAQLNQPSEDRARLVENVPLQKEDTWKDFCDTTSFHGLRYIGGNNASQNGCRVIWGLLWLSMFGLCIWLCLTSVKVYLACDVSTSLTYQIVNRIDFPAITFCNENQFRKSIVGNSFEFMKTLAKLTTTINDPSVLEQIAYEHWEHCHDDRKSYMTDLLNTGDLYWNKYGFVQGMRNITTDAFASIAKFWWNSTEFPVEGYFLNHAIGNGICFTFNPGSKYVADVRNGTTGKVLENFGYGLNITNYSERKLTDAGPQNGLKVLLNTAQQNYCGIGRKWNGAGFKVIVHEPNEQPWFLMQPALSLSPGLETSVVIKPTLFYRKTGHLGRCANDLYLYLTPGMHNHYYKSQCYQQCFYEQVVRKCGCFPPAAYRNQDYYGPVIINGKRVNVTNFCWNQGMICMAQVEEYFVQHNLDLACRCPQPCYETKFDFEISSLLYPSDRLIPVYAEELRANPYTYRHNYLLVNFYFENMNMKVIDEVQAMALTDLHFHIASILSLFLGVSVMSIAEVFHQIRISMLACCIRKLKRS